MKIINLFKFPQCVTWDPKPTKYGIPHYIRTAHVNLSDV